LLKKKKRTFDRTTKVLLGIVIVLLAIIVVSVITYFRASKPYHQAKEEAISMAEKYAKVDEVNEFYWYSREHTYFTVMGETSDNQSVIVVVPKSGDKVQILDPNDGLTAKEAEQVVAKNHSKQTFKKINFGMYQNKPIWEVTSELQNGDLTYTLVSFTSGEEVKTVQMTD
jgi:uncharacterized protein YpmB